MIDFNEAFENLLKPSIEGTAFSSVEGDTGGASKFGISLLFLKQHKIDLSGDGIVNEDDIKALTVEKAKAIYYRYFWLFGDLTNQYVANFCFQIWVNMSPSGATHIFQRALNYVKPGAVQEDGIMGPATIAALRWANPLTLIPELRAQQILHYFKVILNNPSQAKFALGWIRRALT